MNTTKKFVTIVGAILTSVFLLIFIPYLYVEYQEWRAEQQRGSVQHQADVWCQKANNDPGARYYGNPQYLCDSEGKWSKNQPDGELISEGSNPIFLGASVDERMQQDREDQEEHKKHEDQAKKQGQDQADAWCQKVNNNPNVHYHFNHNEHRSYGDDQGVCENPDGSNPWAASWQPDRSLLTFEGELPDDGVHANTVDCATAMSKIWPGLTPVDWGCVKK